MASLLLAGILLFTSNWSLAADADSEGFAVTFYDRKCKIVAPKNIIDNTGLVIENVTMTDMTIKITDVQGQLITFITVPSKSIKSVNLGKIPRGVPTDSVKWFLLPLNPPGQEVILDNKRTVYEIPANKN